MTLEVLEDSCIFCGISTIQIHCNLHHIPICVLTAEYEEIAGSPQRHIADLSRETEATLPRTEDEIEICDAEILDELTTSRGEFKVRTRTFSEDKCPQVILDNEIHNY
ncbi:hypothetical protein HAX54_008561 [Datura stramonium]|uniref:Uncharacterized protein n=1 Tax=Datura stramonium TaxID=4076 RepID=A0ABS8RVS5_DATST|nr:hypothetical protein [Datura stramonium]